MIVLMDLEWIGKQDKRLTQLSALRVNEAWNTLAEFHALPDPGETYLRNAGHMALGGYPPESFAGGRRRNRVSGVWKAGLLLTTSSGYGPAPI